MITIRESDQGQCCQSGDHNPTHRNPCSPPRGIDPVEWAQYNASSNRTLAELSKIPEPPESFTIRVEVTGPMSDLLAAVRRAATDLEGSSPLGDRVSLQLLTALARFHSEVEHP